MPSHGLLGSDPGSFPSRRLRQVCQFRQLYPRQTRPGYILSLGNYSITKSNATLAVLLFSYLEPRFAPSADIQSLGITFRCKENVIVTRSHDSSEIAIKPHLGAPSHQPAPTEVLEPTLWALH